MAKHRRTFQVPALQTLFDIFHIYSTSLRRITDDDICVGLSMKKCLYTCPTLILIEKDPPMTDLPKDAVSRIDIHTLHQPNFIQVNGDSVIFSAEIPVELLYAGAYIRRRLSEIQITLF